jgi:ectoine hydroxylase-related dioxygenase (phytanoyl-CoA dioxygenase family)
MLPFTDSTPLLDDPDALRARFSDDGYVFVRGAVDPNVVRAVRERITTIIADAGWTDPERSMDAVVTGEGVCVEGEDPYFAVYDQIQRLEAFHAVPHQPSVHRLMRALLGETVFPHPLGIARLSFPANDAWATPAHQDYPNNQGTEDLYACWIPLGACPVELGGLSILSGSHRLGVLPLEFALGAGNRRAVLDDRCDDLDWVGGDFELGDAVVFHSLTLHRSLPNQTDRMRLSVDYRFQRQGEPLTEGCLEPHFGRLRWSEIYDGWERTDLQYYWQSLQFDVAPWDPSHHAMPDAALEEAIKDYLLWRKDHPRRGAPPFDPEAKARWVARWDPAAAE